MSYCRWSSDDHQCDLYCYADCYGGYTTHVAARKRIMSEPLPPPVGFVDMTAWLQRDREVRRIIEASALVPVGLTEDGKSFHDDTAEEFLQRIEWLRSLGYRCPDSALDAIREEIQEGAETP